MPSSCELTAFRTSSVSQVLLLDVSTDHQLSKSAVWGSAYMPATLAPIGGDRLLVGDAMSSMSVVEAGEKTLRTVAKVRSTLFPFVLVLFADPTFFLLVP